MKRNHLLMVIALICSTLFQSSIINAQCSCNLNNCTGSVITEDYTVPGSWTPVLTTPGSVTVASSTMNYLNTPGGNYNRMFKNFPTLSVNSQAFVAQCKIAVGSGNSPGHYVMAFTTSSADPISTNVSPFPTTNNDGLFVYLLSPNTPTSSTCCTNPYDVTNPWQFVLRAKDGTVLGAPSAGISMIPTTTIYYVRVVRSKCIAYLHVCTDAAFTNPLPGSPVCITIPETSTNYNFVQHGVITWASPYRKLNMKIDDLRVCPYTNGCNFTPCRLGDPSDATYTPVATDNEILQERLSQSGNESGLFVTPNPGSGLFNVTLTDNAETMEAITVRDISGKVVVSKTISDQTESSNLSLDLSEFGNGTYLVQVSTNIKMRTVKVSIQK